MNIQKVNGCCSMAIISDNPHNIIDKRDLYSDIRLKMLRNHIDLSSIKTVIMITNDNWIDRLLKYWKFGFRKAYTYRGHGGRRTHVLYLNFRKLYKKYR